jgi:ABC-type Zn uptake system ZnuABC Zn-binding protein ZnuA
MKIKNFLLAITLLAVGFTSCTYKTVDNERSRLQVVATTSIVGDVVSQVGGDKIELQVLIPIGGDPHSFEPSPRDITAIAQADVVFASGAGLEVFLSKLIENAGGKANIVELSEGLELLVLDAPHTEDEKLDQHDHFEGDPHVWLDPHNVVVWVDAISTTLSSLDPASAEVYRVNAQIYKDDLSELDSWIKSQVSQIPIEDRLLVTDHTALGYFAARYGFEQIGVIFPGYSTLVAPSAQELANLEDAIQEYNVKAIFVSSTVNPSLAQQITEDTGTQLVTLFTGSLSVADNEAPTYLDLIKYNTDAIVQALR